MIDFANLTFPQTFMLAVILLLACIGFIALSWLIYRISREPRRDELNDWYVGCDPQKVKESWHGK